MGPHDHPFDDVTKKAGELIAKGCTVYQKFTCSGCGSRLTMSEANTFYAQGTCDKCDIVTDIKKQGCNYLFVGGGKR